eukprot:354917-Chlamydomonas_euryale.AAC.12
MIEAAGAAVATAARVAPTLRRPCRRVVTASGGLMDGLRRGSAWVWACPVSLARRSHEPARVAGLRQGWSGRQGLPPHHVQSQTWVALHERHPLPAQEHVRASKHAFLECYMSRCLNEQFPILTQMRINWWVDGWMDG